MSEPSTIVYVASGAILGLLVRECVVRIPPTIAYVRRLHEAAKRESQVEDLRQRISRE